MIDLRYHITSLVAVFIALAVGIVIGSGLVGGPSVQKQNTFIRREIRDIQTRFNTLTQEMRRKDDTIRQLESEVQRSDEVVRALMPAVLHGRLAGRNVAIIQTGDYSEAASAVQSALKDAGAKVTSVTRIVLPKQAGGDDSDVPQEMRNRLASLPSVVASAVVNARDVGALKELAGGGLLVLSGDYTHWNRLVVIVGGASSAHRNLAPLEANLVKSLQGLGVTVVGCEPTNAAVSSIPTYQTGRVSTVDNVDRAAGQMALGFALSGDKGDYGIKSTADRFLPRSLERSR